MENLEYNIRIWEKKKRAAQAQALGAAIVLAGFAIGILVHMFQIDRPLSDFPYLKIGFLLLMTVVFLVSSLSSLTNYTFLYYYFYSQWIKKVRKEELELVTGRIHSIEQVSFPYAGSFKLIELQLPDQQRISYYVKPDLLKGCQISDSIRLLTYHMFVVERMPMN